MKYTVILLLVAFFFTACNENRIYRDNEPLSPNLEWKKSDFREFEIRVDDTSILYNLGVAFRYVHGYPFNTVNLQITETNSFGEETVEVYEIAVREENGDYIGEPGYDIWDVEQLIEADKEYSKSGMYLYKTEHLMPQDPLGFTMEIGLFLDKVIK